MEVRSVVHPSAESLKAFGLGKLDDLLAEAVMLHLDNCAECAQFLAAQSGDDFLNRLREAAGHSPKLRAADSVPVASEKIKGTLSAPATPPPPPDLPPELAHDPNYEILRELGRGGMGVVYLARHRLSGRLEVLKVMNRELLAHPENRERFRREIHAAASLDHRNVVKMYTASELGCLMVLVMEYVEGQTLADKVKERGPLPVLNACYYVQQVALALQHAFERHMVHRDIKPHNLILARDGKNHIVKVLDFGLAKVKSESESDPGITGTGMVLGTPHFMAIEQWLDAAKADIRADIYSLGCTFYYLLTGEMPFDGKSHIEIFQAHQSMEARPLRQLRTDAPEELEAIARKMMAKEPADRFQTPVEVAQALAPIIKQIAKEATTNSSFGAPNAGEKTNAGSSNSGSIAEKRPAPSQPRRKSGAVIDTLMEASITPPDKKDSQILPREENPPDGEPKPKSRKSRWIAMATGAVSIAVLSVLALAAIDRFKIRTTEGTIVIDNLPPGCEVTVDGKAAKLRTSDGKVFDISVAAGTKHQLQIKRDGFRIIGKELELDVGGRETVPLHWEPTEPVASGPTLASGKQRGSSPGSIPETDLFQPGTVWRGSGKQSWEGVDFQRLTDVCLTVLERESDNFVIRFEITPRDIDLKSIRSVSGTIKNNIIQWRAANVKVLIGQEGSDTTGALNKSALELSWEGIATSTQYLGKKTWTKALLQKEADHSDSKGFVQVFNGKDLTGWKYHPAEAKKHLLQSLWQVENGLLVGRGENDGAIPILHSERGDYANFHLRAEVSLNDRGRGGIFYRCPYVPAFPPAYNFEINVSSTIDSQRTGSLVNLSPVGVAGHKSNEWTTIEIIAGPEGLVHKVNGATVADFKDKRFTQGHITFWLTKDTVVRFRKIEIKELPPSLPQSIGGAGKDAESHPAVKTNRLASITGQMQNQWIIDGDELVKTTLQNSTISFGSASWVDYVFTADLLVTETKSQGFGLAFRMREHELYWHGIGTSDSSICKWVNKQFSPIAGSSKREDWLVLNQWYNLSIRVEGDRITSYVNRREITSVRDASIPSGKVGIRAFGVEGRVKNIKVTNLDGQLLWEGLPELPK